MYDEEKKILEVKDIDASLSYGKIYSSKIWDILVVFIAIFAILAMVLASIGLVDVQKDKELIFSVIMGYTMGGIFLIISLIIGLYVSHGRRKAKLFLQDAVLLNAKIKSLGTKIETRFPAVIMSAEALSVTFYNNDRKIVKESTHKGKRFYLVAFKKYANREIKIAYSPKYDEVLFIKSC